MNGVVLVLGFPHEPPVAAVVRELIRMRTSHIVIDQRDLLAGNVRAEWTAEGARGEIEVNGIQIDLATVMGVYQRIMAWSELPEVVTHPNLLSTARSIHEALDSWLETTTCCVINRTSANDTNNSKPYQALIIRDHFDVPATLVTTDPDEVAAFRREFQDIVFKSVSGERSIVTQLSAEDTARLPLLCNAPVQFQELVKGFDVRVHVVGDSVFATRVESDAVDYRYAQLHGGSITPFELPDDVAAECVTLTARLGLELSGIDLRYAEDGRVVCFEVNPSPAYSVYEEATGQPIAAAIARRLAQVI